MKRAVLFILFILSISIYNRAEAQTNFGIGAGLDYGGFGGKFTLMPSPKFGIFGGVGYNLVGVGFNGGLVYKFSPEKRVTPTLLGMYGYNALIKIEDGDASDEVYYGPSFGFGIEVKSRKNELNFWSFELLLPIRSSEFKDDIDILEDAGYSVTEPLPIAFSVGFHFGTTTKE